MCAICKNYILIKNYCKITAKLLYKETIEEIKVSNGLYDWTKIRKFK